MDGLGVGGVEALALEDGEDLAPHAEQAPRGGGQVVADGGVEEGQVVAGDVGVHVVLGVVVHVPVEEGDERVQGKGAAAEAEVGGVGAQADVLGAVAEEEEEAGVEGPQADEDGDEPLARRQRRGGDGAVAGEEGAGPKRRGAAEVRLVGRVALLLPGGRPAQVAGGVTADGGEDGLADGVPKARHVDESGG